MTKRISFCTFILVSVLLFDYVSVWRAGESAPGFKFIQVDAVTGATYCTDVDGDSFCAELGLDCDDTNPDVYPNAPEVCDRIDNNCNEIIDGGCAGCTDTDSDGYAVEGDLCGEIDCNDSEETINPDAKEICDDGIDNNCDNYTDATDETCITDDCEGNFDCDQDCDGTDAATFKTNFGRSTFQTPCTYEFQCHGDFDCDVDVDGTDAALFKSDFGRSPFSNACPICEIGDWCNY